MLEIRRTRAFIDWLARLRDARADAKIVVRVKRMAEGNFGDCEPRGEGVSEMRVHVSPGYRVYFLRRGAALVVLLCGGDKSTQSSDIAKAKAMAKEIE